MAVQRVCEGEIDATVGICRERRSCVFSVVRLQVCVCAERKREEERERLKQGFNNFSTSFSLTACCAGLLSLMLPAPNEENANGDCV